MRTIVVGQSPVELEELIARRRAMGADRYDEVWDGDYHMAAPVSGRRLRLSAQVLTC